MKKVKIFAVVGIVGFLIVSVLTIWAGIAVVKYAVNTTNNVITAPGIQNQISEVKTDLQGMQFQPVSCWSKMQSLVALQPWLDKPALDNIKNLKSACISNSQAPEKEWTI